LISHPAQFTRASLFALLSLSIPIAQAAEVQFDGSYRARFRMYDTLSIDRQQTGSEGNTAYAQHRLWLRPKFLINDQIGLHVEFKGLDNVYWGDEPATWMDPVSQQDIPIAWIDEVSAPTGGDLDDDADRARTSLLDFTLWRAWGDVRTDYGRFSFGRMPLHWGSGVWQNDGLGLNAEYGDTADRIQWEHEIEGLFIRAAYDFNVEGLINENDDSMSFNGAAAYKTERIFAGLNLQLRHIPSLDFNLFTADLAGEAELGKLNIRLEGVGQFGSGDLDNGANDVNISAFGAVLEANVEIKKFALSVEGGFASGDGNLNDEKIHTFMFDRDYNVGIILFEQPMPVLTSGSSTGDPRSYDATLSSGMVSNALYLRPSVQRALLEGLTIEASLLAARTAKMPDAEAARNSYGMEIGLGVDWEPMEHLELSGRGAVFLPGSFYKDYQDSNFPDGFDGTVFGAQFLGRISF